MKTLRMVVPKQPNLQPVVSNNNLCAKRILPMHLSQNPNMSQFLFIGIIGAFAVLSGCAFGQPDPPTRTEEKVISSEVQRHKADIQELADRIKMEHPRPFRFISEADFDILVSSRIDAMSSKATKREFLWAFSEILSSIQCGHSRLPYFNQENALIEAEERLPLDVRFVGDRLFVLTPLTNEERLSKGDEIATINGRSVNELRADIFRHIQAEGVAPNYKVHAFNYYANSYMTYALGFPPEFRVTLVDDETPIQLRPLTDFEFKPLFHPNDPCQDRLCYRVDQATNTGIMTIHSFAYYGEKGQILTDFVDTSIADITENSRSALVVDIRFHDGGSGNAGAYILRRIAKAPFTYFGENADRQASPDLLEVQIPVDVGLDMPVFLIVDSDTVSSAPHFAALFKEHQMGTIVGEAMGGNKSTNDGSQSFRSSAHGIEYKIARIRFDVEAPGQSLDEAVQPDVSLSYSVSDVLNGEDSMMKYVLGIVGLK